VSRYKVDKWPRGCLGSRRFVNGHWCSVAVQTVSEPEICHGAGVNLRADARVRVRWLAGLVWVAVNCKNRDKQLTFIVRVMLSVLLFI